MSHMKVTGDCWSSGPMDLENPKCSLELWPTEINGGRQATVISGGKLQC
jgi:hypothetical protein